jgi:hypothetical protein
MVELDLGIIDASKQLHPTSLEAEQAIPYDTLFRNNLYDEPYESVQVRNEAIVIRDTSSLI